MDDDVTRTVPVVLRSSNHPPCYVCEKPYDTDECEHAYIGLPDSVDSPDFPPCPRCGFVLSMHVSIVMKNLLPPETLERHPDGETYVLNSPMRMPPSIDIVCLDQIAMTTDPTVAAAFAFMSLLKKLEA